MTTPLALIDLFSGCGGLTRGFSDEGFVPVQAVESDPAAAATYAANFGESHTHCADIRSMEDGQVAEADVVIGGPPCQGFSNLGSRDVDDPRNKLWKEFLRFVQVAHPKVFVVENVARFSRSPEYRLLHEEARSGMIQEYELSSAVLSAADFGVAQRRSRTILIGSRVGPIGHPAVTHSAEAGIWTEPWTTVRSRIEGLPETPDSGELPCRTVDFFGRSFPGSFSSTELHVGRSPRERSLQRYDCIPPGGGRFDLPDELLSECWRRKPTGTTDVMGRMKWDAPSLTIRTEFFKPEKGQYLHPQWDAADPLRRVNRPITHLEAARLQDFPDDHRWCGSKIEIARQIGNAVPVGLARAIARGIREHLERDVPTYVPGRRRITT